MSSENPVREWAIALVGAARSCQLSEVISRLESHPADQADKSDFLLAPIEGLLLVTASVRLRELSGDLVEHLSAGNAARWLYGIASARASGDLPFDEWRGVLDLAAGDVTASVPSSSVRRIRALAVLVSLIVPAGGSVALESDQVIPEGRLLLREAIDFVEDFPGDLPG